VDSVLDADRLDYLLRDARVLGGEVGDLPGLIERVRAVAEDGLLRLAFPADRERSVAGALALRRRLYRSYYEHSDKLIVDDMICHALFYILNDKGVLRQDEDRLSTERQRRILQSVLFLTDEDFFPALSELRADPHCYDLLIRARQHNYFVPICVDFLHRDSLRETKARFAEWMEVVDVWSKETAKTRNAHRYADVKRPTDIADLRRVSTAFLAQRELLVLGFQWKARGQFRERLKFERGVWARVLEHDPDGKVRRIYLQRQYGRADYCDLDLLDRFPPLHVTTTSSVRLDSDADIEYASKEGFVQHQVLFYRKNENGVPIMTERKLVPTEIETRHEVYPVVVSAPPALVSAVGEDTLRDAYVAELQGCVWLWELLSSGRELAP